MSNYVYEVRQGVVSFEYQNKLQEYHLPMYFSLNMQLLFRFGFVFIEQGLVWIYLLLLFNLIVIHQILKVYQLDGL